MEWSGVVKGVKVVKERLATRGGVESGRSSRAVRVGVDLRVASCDELTMLGEISATRFSRVFG